MSNKNIGESAMPELGQLCFGQPWQNLKCPENVVTALQSLALVWDCTNCGDAPFGNSGVRYDGKVFSAHAYSWNEDEKQQFNFKWRDVRVSWYKYLGRNTTINRLMTDDELRQMLKECLMEIINKKL
jgi:hypothetical protein